MNDNTSSGVDVNKLCSRDNPLVHYHRLGARGAVARVALMVGCAALIAGVIYWPNFIGMSTGNRYYWSFRFRDLLTHARDSEYLFAYAMFIACTMITLGFAALSRDPRKHEGIVELVLTLLKPKQIFLGSIWSGVVVPVGCATLLLSAAMLITSAMVGEVRVHWLAPPMKSSFAAFLPMTGIMLLIAVYTNVRGWTMGGYRGLFWRAWGPVLAFPMMTYAFTDTLVPKGAVNHFYDGNAGFLNVLSRTILLWAGFAFLAVLARKSLSEELIPLFMKGAHPEESVRAYWYARELAARAEKDSLVEGRARLRVILGKDRISDFLIALASQIAVMLVFQNLNRNYSLDDYFRNSHTLILASCLSTICVVLRRMYLPPCRGIPIISGAIRESVRRWYLPVVMAQILGATLPLAFCSGIRFSLGDYILSHVAGMLLGYIMFLLLVPGENRRRVFKGAFLFVIGIIVAAALIRLDSAHAIVQFKASLGDHARYYHDASSTVDYGATVGFVMRVIALFFGLALLVDLRGLLLQRIHVSEVLNRPAGTLSSDPTPDDPGAAIVPVPVAWMETRGAPKPPA